MSRIPGERAAWERVPLFFRLSFEKSFALCHSKNPSRWFLLIYPFMLYNRLKKPIA